MRRSRRTVLALLVLHVLVVLLFVLGLFGGSAFAIESFGHPVWLPGGDLLMAAAGILLIVAISMTALYVSRPRGDASRAIPFPSPTTPDNTCSCRAFPDCS